MRFPQTRRVIGLLAAVVFVIAATAATIAPSAQAGDYTVSYCRDANGKPVELLDWIPISTSNGFGLSATQGCKANYSPMAAAFTENVASQQTVGWTLQADGGLVIVKQSASGTTTLGTGADAEFGLVGRCFEGAHEMCADGRWGKTDFVPPTGPKTAIDFRLTCRATAGCPPSDIQVLQNVVGYRDSTPPAGAVRAGSLTNTGFGAPAAGTVSADVSASDAGSGVRRFQAIVDGDVAGATQEQCAPPYGRMHPCPSGGNATVAVDTTTLTDGTHALQIVAEDASGERTILHDGLLVVGNNPAVGPGGDINVRGPQNGSYGADDVKVTAWWSATARKPTSNKRIQKKCTKSKSYRRSHKVLCEGRPASRQLSAPYSSKKLNVIRGRAVAANGQPVAGATLQLVAAPSATGAAPTVVATPVTDGTGRFEARVPVATGSASYAVQWVARVRDTTPAAAVTLRRKVKSATTFKASPRRVVRRGRTLVLSGKLRGTAGSAKGNAVLVQASAGSSWRAVKTVRSQADGTWQVRYRVPRQLRGTYRFRAVVSPSAAYPYTVGRSSSRKIRVR